MVEQSVDSSGLIELSWEDLGGQSVPSVGPGPMVGLRRSMHTVVQSPVEPGPLGWGLLTL